MIPRYCARCKAVHGKTCPLGDYRRDRAQWQSRQRGGASGRGGHKWSKARERVFARDGYLCQMHMQRGELVTVQLHGEGHGVLDHVVALSAGGSDEDDNLQTLCQDCDKVKTASESRKQSKIDRVTLDQKLVV